ncbi:MAG: VOC family protein, partial [Actinomycetota bacterium]
MNSARANPVVHLELHTADLARACSFYTRTCGWNPERIDAGRGSYVAFKLGGQLGGGVVECETPRPLWLPYVEVGEISEA